MRTVILAAHLAVSIAGLVFSGATLAQSTWSGTWDWNLPCDPATCSVTGATGTVTATVSAYGAESASGSFAAASIYNGSNSYLGITSAGENTTNPNHSIDNFRLNNPGSTCSTCSQGGADYAEALQINFNQAVNLTQVAVSWTSTDSDAMIFRWDGAGNPDLLTTTPTGGNGLLAKGWTLVSSGQFSATAGAAGQLAVVTNPDVYSSYWLVSTALSQTNATSGAGKTNTNNDGFKVSSFAGNIYCSGTIDNGVCKPPGSGGGQQVPEPGTLALAAAAFLGLTATRRRQRTIR